MVFKSKIDHETGMQPKFVILWRSIAVYEKLRYHLFWTIFKVKKWMFKLALTIETINIGHEATLLPSKQTIFVFSFICLCFYFGSILYKNQSPRAPVKKRSPNKKLANGRGANFHPVTNFFSDFNLDGQLLNSL